MTLIVTGTLCPKIAPPVRYLIVLNCYYLRRLDVGECGLNEHSEDSTVIFCVTHYNHLVRRIISHTGTVGTGTSIYVAEIDVPVRTVPV